MNNIHLCVGRFTSGWYTQSTSGLRWKSYSNSRSRCYGRIQLSLSTVNRTYELLGITPVTPFHKYGKHSTGPSTYGPWVRTYNKLFSCMSVLMVSSYRAQSNEICTYGRVSRGSLLRVRRYSLLYLRTVEYNLSQCILATRAVYHG